MNTSFLVPVFSGSFNTQTELLCNARDLHKALQVGRKFATWITERIKEYGFVENQDYILISQNWEIKIILRIEVLIDKLVETWQY